MKRRDFLSCLSLILVNPKLVLPEFEPRKKVLINPGHNKDVFKHGYGCYIKEVGYEYVLNTQIAGKIQKILRNAGLEAIVTRDEKEYLPGIKEYRTKNKQALLREVKAYQSQRNSRNHNTPVMPLNEALTQLSILKWAEANPFDLLLNIHINFPGEKYRGKFSGFAVIISDKHNDFSKSKALAQDIYDSLIQDFKPSNNKSESALMKKGKLRQYVPGFMINDFLMLGTDLYAAKIPSILVECGYISQKYDISSSKGQGSKSNEQKLSIAHGRVQEQYALRISEGVLGFLKSTAKHPDLLFQ